MIKARRKSENAIVERGEPVPGRGRAHSWIRRDFLVFEEHRVSFWCDDVAIDLGMGIAWRGNEPISLRPLEARLLSFLFTRAGQLVPSVEVRRHLYGAVSEESASLRLRSLIADMRRRIGDGMNQSLRTARGVGFILYARPRTNAEPASPEATADRA